MDNQLPPAAYNPTNLYDPSTPMGMMLLDDIRDADARAESNTGDFGKQVRLFAFQIVIFAIVGIGFTVFG
ncbi:hypothetical protein PK98_14995 [Croceibacterium mercuriale]|uniref:Uncharacterized protein n=1 Tax=Croceibacterium mercuriale TaxID=1572751 RepID=A0A0B2BWR9_9SPHN|nr:hypothetical protein [Croceibacterium mercuriale]KHL24270.1 hypothetical protein PK98_14995 [Croceibacterium mercuriale]